MFTQVVLALALSASALTATVHNVTVGGPAGKVFTPASVEAAVGDVVQFWFVPGPANQNHTVTQSTFVSPCARLHNATDNTEGFDSGFMPVKAGSTDPPAMFEYRVNSTDPIWYYCAQGPHCKLGMVGSINAKPTGPKTFDAFRSKAMQSTPANGASPGSGTPPAPSSASSLFIPGVASAVLGVMVAKLFI